MSLSPARNHFLFLMYDTIHKVFTLGMIGDGDKIKIEIKKISIKF